MSQHLYLPTVWHTGTHVLADKVVKWEELRREGWIVHKQHTNQEWRYPNDYPGLVLSSLRHPRRVRASWKARGVGNDSTFNTQFDNLIRIWSPWVKQWLIVDQPGLREWQVQKIGELLDKPLYYDFNIVNAESGSNKGLHAVPLENCPEVPQVYIDFYEEILNASKEAQLQARV